MRHFVYLLIIAGAFITTACSTTGTTDEADQDSATEAAEPAEATKPQSTTETATEEAAPAAAESQAPAMEESSSDGTITYVCMHDSSVRTIRVIYPDDGPACEVTYEKSSGTQTLWSANNDESYCADKAVGFVAKQEGWGWECNKQ